MLPTLNIVVYTDYPDWFHENPLDPNGGLVDLKAFVKEKTKQFGTAEFKFVSRHDTDPPILITRELLTGAHELWVFGYRLTDKPEEPNNKLKQSEIDLLEEFISQGKIGIFLTGDHSESEVKAKCGEVSHENF